MDLRRRISFVQGQKLKINFAVIILLFDIKRRKKAFQFVIYVKIVSIS